MWLLVAVLGGRDLTSTANRHRDMIGYVVATITDRASLFFLALLIFSKNPFATFLTAAPLDGQGLNPLLQNYWMVDPPAVALHRLRRRRRSRSRSAWRRSSPGRLDDRGCSSVRAWMLIALVLPRRSG